MNSLVNANIQTMSSKEIAELTGKSHSHVLRDVREMLESLDHPKMVHEQFQEVKDNRGYTAEFLLDKELSIILVSGYSVQMRAKIVRRWLELENKAIQETSPKLLTKDEYKSELMRIKLEEAKKKLDSTIAKEEAKKLKYDQQKEILIIQHTTKLEVMRSKNMRLLNQRDIKVRADLVIGKIIAPISTVTDLLKEHKINIKPAVFNSLLIKHGYLQANRMFLTDKGLTYGVNHKSKNSSNYSMPRWFENEFGNLVDEIRNLEPNLFQ